MGISRKDQLINNLEILDYEIVSETKEVIILKKLNNRFDIDFDTKEVRFFKKSQASDDRFKLYKTFGFKEFADISGEWIKKNIK